MGNLSKLSDFLLYLKAINANFDEFIHDLDTKLLKHEKTVFKLFIELDNFKELLSSKYQESLKLHNKVNCRSKTNKY